MIFQGTKLLIFFAALVKGIYSGPNECRDALAPPSKPRGVNQVDRMSGTPLFELHVTPINNRRNPVGVTAYKISISIEEGKPFRFSEATLAVKTNGTCGSGDFEFNTKDFVEVVQEHGENCPRLIQTKRKTHMTELSPLTWLPPSCGCVQFRILIVESEEVYYAEEEEVATGPLAKVVCLQQHQQGVKISREQRLASLCHVIDKHSSGEIMSRSQFLKRRQLETKLMDRLGIEMALELRRHDAKACCHKENHEKKSKCFDNARRRRIDQFCANGMSEIPFRTFRRSHMRNLEKSCCFILGEYRYKCFAKNSKLALDSEDEATVFDYSMDASDVVNDLADFGSHEHLDEFLRPRQFDDEDDDEEEQGEDDDKEYEEFEDDEVMDDDSEEDEVIYERHQPTEKTIASKKKYFLQRTPPRHNNNKRVTGSLKGSTAVVAKHERLSNEELGRKLRKQFRRRNSQEQRRLSKAERTNHNRGSRGRRRGQKGSLEKLEKIRKLRHESDDTFRRQSSKERRMFYKPRVADTHGKGSGRSREVKDRGHKERRQPMTVESDPMTPTEDDFEHLGGVSMDKTLRKLQRRIRRLKLRNMCCKAGVEVGGQVYGRIGQVTEECRDSSLKFVRGLDLISRSRKCASQFIDCCLEEVKKGVPMTSQEFLDNTMNYYWDNNQRFDSRLMGRVLAQRKRQPQYLGRDPYAKPSRQYPEDQKTSHQRHNVLSKRFETVQQRESFITPDTQEKQPVAATTTTAAAVATATTVQRSPMPGKVSSVSQGKERKRIKSDKNIVGATTNAPTRVTNSQSQLKPSLGPSMQEKNIPGTQKRVVYVDLEESPASVDVRGTKTKMSTTDGSGRGFKSFRKEMSREDFDDGYRRPMKFGDVDNDGLDDDSDNSDENRKGNDNDKDAVVDVKESVDGEEERNKLNKEKIIQEKQSSQKEDKFIEIIHHEKTKSKLDNSGQPENKHGRPVHNKFDATNTRASQQIQNVDEEDDRIKTQIKQRRRERQKSQRQRNKRKRHHSKSTNGMGALDSREMAERNARKFADALDSKEMADQYKIRNPYRFPLRQYKYSRRGRVLSW